MEDFGDLLLARLSASGARVEDFLRPPDRHKNSGGADLIGYPAESLWRLALLYWKSESVADFAKSRQLLEDLRISIAMEEFALQFKTGLLQNAAKVPFLQACETPQDVMQELYARYMNISKDELQRLVDTADAVYTEAWKKAVPDEDAVTGAQLGAFYGGLPFPIGCLSLFLLRTNNFGLACRALPVMLLQQFGDIRNVFDFGGNVGETISSIAAVRTLDRCLLVEENASARKFAEWRNDLLGVRGIEYASESQVSADPARYQGQFELGICTEVLEHVMDVEDTLAGIARLLKKNGLLYITTSFGYFPHASHLKKNRKYHGKESALMARHNLRPIAFEFPFPPPTTLAIYQKV